jgi:hypothetical protein
LRSNTRWAAAYRNAPMSASYRSQLRNRATICASVAVGMTPVPTATDRVPLSSATAPATRNPIRPRNTIGAEATSRHGANAQLK